MARAKKKRKMTAATLSRSPLSVGAAFAGPVARVSYWALWQAVDFGSWAVMQFRRAPLAISLVAAAAGFSLLAGSNALFLQTSHHPAPWFFSAPHQTAAPAPVVRPVTPAVRPRQQPALDNQTTGSLGSQLPAVDAITSNDILSMQKKLAGLKLFDATPDGLFGRRTASAIKAFELHTGRAPRGKLTREILMAVLSSSPVAEPMPPPAAVNLGAARPAAVVPLAPARPATAVTAVASVPAPTIAAPTDLVASHAAPPSVGKLAPLAIAVQAPAAQPAESASQPDGNTIAMNSPPAAANNAAPAVAPIASAPALVANIAPSGPAPTTSAAQKLAAQMGTLPPSVATALPTPISDDDNASTDPALISKIQQALASLGFLGNNIDGLPGEATAKAIRSFQVFYDYPVTGQASPQLLDLLIQHGATI
jgi:peptidoglycan hydrolase-like protein with peptidoglycan-binding domain